MAQKNADYAKAMLRRSAVQKEETAPALDISDRERYYFKRMSIMNEGELVGRNSKRDFITKKFEAS